MTAAVLQTVTVTVESGAQLVASWQRGASPFCVRVRVATSGGPTYIGTSQDAGQSGFRLDENGGELSLSVPALGANETAATEELWAFVTAGVAYVSTAVDPC